MKSIRFMAGFLLLSSSILFTNCTADRDALSTPGEIIAQGSWSVQTLYAGSDQTGRFAGYAFSFGPGGKMTVSNSDTKTTGSWRWFRNVRSEVLQLDLPDHSTLTVLDDQWTLKQWGRYTMTLSRGADLLVLQQLPVR